MCTSWSSHVNKLNKKRPLFIDVYVFIVRYIVYVLVCNKVGISLLIYLKCKFKLHKLM